MKDNNSTRKVLEDKYGDKLRLHCYSVVALGFERLVWTEVGEDPCIHRNSDYMKTGNKSVGSTCL